MSETLSTALITNTREQLATLATTIAANIKPEALKDIRNPFIWSNYGSYNAGKSLVAETAASHLAGEDIRGYFESEAGMFGFDSEFHSYRDGNGWQFQFCDIYFPWSGGIFGQRKNQQRNLVPKIVESQTGNGIAFIHNAPEAARDNGAAIEMHIRSRRKFSDFFNANARNMPAFAKRSLKRLDLHGDYKSACSTSDRNWIRLVEISIRKHGLFNPEFLDNFENTEDIKALLNESLYESTNPEILDL